MIGWEIATAITRLAALLILGGVVVGGLSIAWCRFGQWWDQVTGEK